MVLSLYIAHNFAFSCLPHGFWATILVLLSIEALKEEGFIVFVKLYGFCLSIAYIVCQCHPYIESLQLSDYYIIQIILLIYTML